MKIEKIIFRSHPLFKKDFEICFKRGDKIPFITYLVGNNGSGKTNLLDSIYRGIGGVGSTHVTKNVVFNADFFINIDESEKEQYNLLQEDTVVYNINFTSINGWNSGLKNLNGDNINFKGFDSLRKIIYTTAEVKYLASDIKSVTASNVDDKNVEVSENLSNTIPQLLVDIDTVDNNEKIMWLKNESHKTYEDIPENVGGRLARFNKGFDLIYQGSIKFSKIENVNGTKQILFTNSKGEEIDISDLSSGEQQILYRVGHILKNLNLISGGIILIDEPELSLHPIWQERFRAMLIEIFKGLDVQIIIATHSPYIFKGIDNDFEQVILLDANNGIYKQLDTNLLNGKYLSASYINYIAYGIIDYELHIELYDLLLQKILGDKSDSPTDLDKILINNMKEPVRVSFIKTGETKETQETLMTRIRNKMHHREKNRPNFTENDLRESIERMLLILRN